MDKKRKQVLMTTSFVAFVILLGMVYSIARENKSLVNVTVISENIFSFYTESAYKKKCSINFEKRMGIGHGEPSEENGEKKERKYVKNQTIIENYKSRKEQENFKVNKNKENEITEPDSIVFPEALRDMPERMEENANDHAECSEGIYELPILITELEPNDETPADATESNSNKKNPTVTTGVDSNHENHMDTKDTKSDNTKNEDRDQNKDSKNKNYNIKNSKNDGQKNVAENGNYALDTKENSELPFVPVR